MFTQPNYLNNYNSYQGYSPTKGNTTSNKVVLVPTYISPLQMKHNSIINGSYLPKNIETPIKTKMQQSDISLKTSSNSNQNGIQSSKQNKQTICNVCSKSFKNNSQKLHLDYHNKANQFLLKNSVTPSVKSLDSSKISTSKKCYKQFNPLELYDDKIKQMKLKAQEEKNMKPNQFKKQQSIHTPFKSKPSNIQQSPIKTIKKQIPKTQHITPPKTSQIFKPHNLGIQSYSQNQKAKYQDQFSIYQLLNQQSFEIQEIVKSNKMSVKSMKKNNKNIVCSKQTYNQTTKNKYPFKAYQSPIKPQFESMSFQSLSLKYLI